MSNLIYKEYLKSKDWADKRKKKLKGKKKCAFCQTTTKLEPHHLIYKDLFSVENKDLRVVCRKCHLEIHKLMKEGKIIFSTKDPNKRYYIIKRKLAEIAWENLLESIINDFIILYLDRITLALIYNRGVRK